jgi:hypothetical protein
MLVNNNIKKLQKLSSAKFSNSYILGIQFIEN